MPNMEETKEANLSNLSGDGCQQCDDSVLPSALLAAVRYIRKELLGMPALQSMKGITHAGQEKLDDIEEAALTAQSIERRVTGL